MPQACQRLLRRLAATWLAGVISLLGLPVLLGGCASTAPPPAPGPLLHDSLFGSPPRPAGADRLMALSPPMQDFLRKLRQRSTHPTDLPGALADALYRPGGLRLDYDATVTRDAAQAFADRAGNCLSLVLMTAALAQDLGLAVDFQAVTGADVHRLAADLNLRAGHVNLRLAAPRPPSGLGVTVTGHGREQVLIDFLPPGDAARLRTEAIGQQRVLAMVANNRAVESLLAGQGAEAYAWARESLRLDPGFWPAYNTLGVVYQRASHLAEAAAVFEHVLARDAAQVPAMANLAQVRRAQGRDAEADAWDRRRTALEPYPPFHFLRRGLAALAAGDAGGARQLFRREIGLHGGSHEAYFGLARAHLAAGEPAAAEQALRNALDASATQAEQSRYAGKLAALRARLVH